MARGKKTTIKEKEQGGDFPPEDKSDMGTAEEERARMLEDVLRDEAMLFDKMAWKLFEGRIASLKEDSAAAEEAKATTEDSGQKKVGKEEEDLQVTSGEKTVLAQNEKEQNKGGALPESKDDELDFQTRFDLMIRSLEGSMIAMKEIQEKKAAAAVTTVTTGAAVTATVENEGGDLPGCHQLESTAVKSS